MSNRSTYSLRPRRNSNNIASSDSDIYDTSQEIKAREAAATQNDSMPETTQPRQHSLRSSYDYSSPFDSQATLPIIPLLASPPELNTQQSRINTRSQTNINRAPVPIINLISQSESQSQHNNDNNNNNINAVPDTQPIPRSISITSSNQAFDISQSMDNLLNSINNNDNNNTRLRRDHTATNQKIKKILQPSRQSGKDEKLDSDDAGVDNQSVDMNSYFNHNNDLDDDNNNNVINRNRKKNNNNSHSNDRDSDGEYFDVERILRYSKDRDGSEWYLIKWKGYPESSATWQMPDDLHPELIDDFKKEQAELDKETIPRSIIHRNTKAKRVFNILKKKAKIPEKVLKTKKMYPMTIFEQLLDKPKIIQLINSDKTPQDIALKIIKDNKWDTIIDDPPIPVTTTKRRKVKVNYIDLSDSEYSDRPDYSEDEDVEDDDINEADPERKYIDLQRSSSSTSSIILNNLQYDLNGYQKWELGFEWALDRNNDKMIYKEQKYNTDTQKAKGKFTWADGVREGGEYDLLVDYMQGPAQQYKQKLEYDDSALDMIAFIDLEVHETSELSNLSQICAVSLNGKRVYNKYITRFYESYLAEAWQQLVESEYVDIDPSDDPKQSFTFDEAIIHFCKVWPEGTLFIYQGSRDYATLIQNFRNHYSIRDTIASNIFAAITEWIKRQYRFISVDTFFKTFPIDLPGKKALHSIYRGMFYNSLLYNNAMKMFVYDITTKIFMRRLLLHANGLYKTIDSSFKNVQTIDGGSEQENKDRMDFETVDIWYDTTASMAPVFHYAHTDTLVLRNIVIAQLIYLQHAHALAKIRLPNAPTPQDAQLQMIFEEMMTYIVVNTGVFRKTHLGCNDKVAANVLLEILQNNTDAIHNTLFTAYYISAEPPKHSPIAEANDIRHRKTEYFKSVILSPESVPEQVSLNDFRSELDEKTDTIYEFKIFNNDAIPLLKIKPPSESHKSTVNRHETLSNIIFTNNKNLQGDGCPLPPLFEFNQSDMMNFAAIRQKAELQAIDAKISEADKEEFINKIQKSMFRKINDTPCIIVLTKKTSFPKTFILHNRFCKHVGYEHNTNKPKKSHEQSLYIVEFEKNVTFSFRLRFCKDCKQWANHETRSLIPLYGPKAEAARKQEIVMQQKSDIKYLAEVISRGNEKLGQGQQELAVALTKIKQENPPPPANVQQPIVNNYNQIQLPPEIINAGPASRTRAQINNNKKSHTETVGQPFYSNNTDLIQNAKTRNRNI